MNARDKIESFNLGAATLSGTATAIVILGGALGGFVTSPLALALLVSSVAVFASTGFGMALRTGDGKSGGGSHRSPYALAGAFAAAATIGALTYAVHEGLTARETPVAALEQVPTPLPFQIASGLYIQP